VPVDPRAAAAFGGDAGPYELGRPGYPPAAVAHVAATFGLTRGSTVVDLAAGTGKLARALTAVAGTVIAVEPSDGMLAVLREVVPEARAVRGTAEALPLPAGSVDAVLVGEAFHWFDVAAAGREIARVLRPGGGLALLFNREQRAEPDPPWLARVREVVGPHLRAFGPHPAFSGPHPARGEGWSAPLDDLGLFAPLPSASFPHVDELTPERFVALVASWSWIAVLAPAVREEVLAQVRAAVAGEARLVLRYRTRVDTATALPRPGPAGARAPR